MQEALSRLQRPLWLNAVLTAVPSRSAASWVVNFSCSCDPSVHPLTFVSPHEESVSLSPNRRTTSRLAQSKLDIDIMGYIETYAHTYVSAELQLNMHDEKIMQPLKRRKKRRPHYLFQPDENNRAAVEVDAEAPWSS